MMKAKEDIKNGTFKQNFKKKANKDVPPEEKDLLDSRKHMTYEMKLPGMNRPLKPVPVFKQQLGENKRAFFYRMDTTMKKMSLKWKLKIKRRKSWRRKVLLSKAKKKKEKLGENVKKSGKTKTKETMKNLKTFLIIKTR